MSICLFCFTLYSISSFMSKFNSIIFKNLKQKIIPLDTFSKTCKISSALGIPSFSHRSFAHFVQIKWATVSNSLRSLKTNKRLWANHPGCSRHMSDCKRFAQIAPDKWATVSKLLRSLTTNEQPKVICSGRSW